MNDTEKAIDVLKRLRIATVADRVDGFRIFKPLSMAISALEKQMPKVPTRQKFGAWEVYNGLCESCLTSIRADMNYCPECGQKIDWTRLED